MDISDIKKRWDEGYYTVKFGDFNVNTLPENHIFDENLSVKENREMVRQHNIASDARNKEYIRLRNAKFLELRQDICNYIVATYNLSMPQAEKLEAYVYTEKHSYMCDYFIAIDELAELVENIIQL